MINKITLDGAAWHARDPLCQVPAEGKYWRTRHDFENEEWGYKPRSIALEYRKDPPANALPETIPTVGCKAHGDFAPLDEAWQWFWFGLLERAAPGKSAAELRTAWASLTANARALTDRHAVQNGFCDYVLRKNLGAEPMAIKCLSMGGNILRQIGTAGGKYVVEALDASAAPPNLDEVWGKWWLIHWCTESTTLALSGRRWQVGRFPQLEPFGSPFPFVTLDGTNKIEKHLVAAIDNRELYSPYVLR